MLKDIIARLFSKTVGQSERNIEKNRRDAQRYFDISKENVTAIVANALSILAFGDSSVAVDLNGETTKRTELLNQIAQKEFIRAKRKISAALGVGMIASIPYCSDNGLGKKIYVDTITKDRFWITGAQGDDITAISALSDVVEIGNNKYMRWTDYSVKGGAYVVRNKATNESGKEVPLSSVYKWWEICPEIAVSGVDRLPVAFYSCPTGERRPDSIEGVPITFGCDSILEKIEKTLKDIEDEFDLKKVKLIIPDSMIYKKRDKNGNIIKNQFDSKLFVKVADNDGDNNITVFDPQIRESVYFSKLQAYFSLLEKAIGCSKGILTDLLTQGATATEIKRSMNSTFCLTDDIRKEYKRYFDDLIYSVNVLCNYYNLSPISDYTINFDWNYSLLEDSEQTFNQMKDGKSEGVISSVEMRRFLKPDETPEEAQKAVEEIKKNEPSMKSLIGIE